MASTGENTFQFYPPKHHPKCRCDALRSFKCEEIDSYSCDGENMFLPDDSQIRYLCLPEDPDEVLFDLKDNFETFIERDRSHEMIDRVLKCLQHIDEEEKKNKKRDHKSVEDDLANQLAGLQLDPDIVSRRGLLAEIMRTPYLLQSKNKDGWSVTAIKYNNRIFLSRSHRPQETWGTAEERQLSTYTGSKFEQYVSKKTADGPAISELNEIVDTRKGFYSMTKAQLGKHKLIYAGEIDCCDLDAKGPKRTYVQFKTSAMLPEPPKYFQSLKLLKWWAQSALVDIPKIVCGIKDHDAVVYQVKTYKVDQLPATSNNQWSPCVCFSFLDTFLSHVKKVLVDVPDNPRIAHVFTWPPGEKVVKHEQMAPDSEYCFLPEWFYNSKET